jgi:glutamate N-acetyltransferase / amino-acid N-acetyltransferase
VTGPREASTGPEDSAGFEAQARPEARAFFRSRWVERPGHVAELEPAGLPAGFRSAGVSAGIKPDGLDVGVLASDGVGTTSAARFTASAVVGAPVAVSRRARLDGLRAVVASSGNANVADGDRGLETAAAAQSAAAAALGLEAAQVGVAATGVIGRELPRDRLVKGVERAASELGEGAGPFSEALLTTDRAPKRACLEVRLPSGTVRLAAQAKGAGMISPAFATVLCFVETDAEVEAGTLDLLTGVTVKRSLERISVDGQLSTSDTVFCLASGKSGVRVDPETDDELALGEAMDALLRQIALDVAADGEGARRVGRVIVRGEAEAVEPVARAVADSPLVKAALHGGDPNFGRVLQAVGQALAGPARGALRSVRDHAHLVGAELVEGGACSTGDAFPLDLEIEGRRVVSGGVAHTLDGDELRALQQDVTADEVEYRLTLPGEGGETEVFFSDLSHDYVTLNAEYTT